MFHIFSNLDATESVAVKIKIVTHMLAKLTICATRLRHVDKTALHAPVVFLTQSSGNFIDLDFQSNYFQFFFFTWEESRGEVYEFQFSSQMMWYWIWWLFCYHFQLHLKVFIVFTSLTMFTRFTRITRLTLFTWFISLSSFIIYPSFTRLVTVATCDPNPLLKSMAFLTIENTSPNIHSDPLIESDTGHHSQFLRCLHHDIGAQHGVCSRV